MFRPGMILLCCVTLHLLTGGSPAMFAADRPNILWITSEDNGLELGCYGDDYATSPHIDALAEQGMKYLYCWSSAPVCAPARTTIISGMYPTSLGAEHMRSNVPLPQDVKMYPQYLRAAGYYCTNNNKEDYNLIKPNQVWDDSSRRAHWKNRAEGQPFFAIFNHTVSHESQIRRRPHTPVHDPALAKVPAYHPDIPEARRDWAQYYDIVTEMDELVGKNIAELKEAGLFDDTIIFYYGDHGSGMPRHKRWPYNSGLHVPLIVHFPEKYKHLAPPEYQAGGSSDRLVAFVDLAPTLLSLCGLTPPEHLQGNAFAGPHCTEKQPYIFGFRGRMDERIDMVRSVRNERFVYLRQFYQYRPYGQYLNFMFQTPTTRKWYDMYQAGQLNETQSRFWEPKPIEELYDLQQDPQEINNLADNPEYADVIHEMRDVLGKWMLEIKDVGVFPEAEWHRRSDGASPYDLLRQGGLTDDYFEVLATCLLATRARWDDVQADDIRSHLKNPEPAVRYWVCQFLLQNGEHSVNHYTNELLTCLKDESPSVRITAAEILGRFGSEQSLQQALPVLVQAADLRENDVYTAIEAWNALDYLDDKAKSIRDQLADLPEKVDKMPPRTDSYIPRLKEKTLADLDGLPLP